MVGFIDHRSVSRAAAPSNVGVCRRQRSKPGSPCPIPTRDRYEGNSPSCARSHAPLHAAVLPARVTARYHPPRLIRALQVKLAMAPPDGVAVFDEARQAHVCPFARFLLTVHEPPVIEQPARADVAVFRRVRVFCGLATYQAHPTEHVEQHHDLVPVAAAKCIGRSFYTMKKCGLAQTIDQTVKVGVLQVAAPPATKLVGPAMALLNCSAILASNARIPSESGRVVSGPDLGVERNAPVSPSFTSPSFTKARR